MDVVFNLLTLLACIGACAIVLGNFYFIHFLIDVVVKTVKKIRKKSQQPESLHKEPEVISRIFTPEEVIEVVKVLQNENIDKIFVRMDADKPISVLNIVDFDISSLNFRFIEQLISEHYSIRNFSMKIGNERYSIYEPQGHLLKELQKILDSYKKDVLKVESLKDKLQKVLRTPEV